MATKRKNQIVKKNPASVVAARVNPAGLDLTLNKNDLIALLLSSERERAQDAFDKASEVHSLAVETSRRLYKEHKELVLSEALRLIRNPKRGEADGLRVEHDRWSSNAKGNVSVILEFQQTSVLRDLEAKIKQAKDAEFKAEDEKTAAARRLEYLDSKEAEREVRAQMTKNVLSTSEDGKQIVALLKQISINVPTGK